MPLQKLPASWGGFFHKHVLGKDNVLKYAKIESPNVAGLHYKRGYFCLSVSIADLDWLCLMEETPIDRGS